MSFFAAVAIAVCALRLAAGPPSWVPCAARPPARSPAGLLDDGHITSDTHVWKQGCSDWRKLSDTPDLKYLVGDDGEDAAGEGKRAKRPKRVGTGEAHTT
jgi:hypothetical protein